LICHVAFCTPYVVLSVLPRVRQMDNSVYEAALDLGATPMRALWKIVIPEIMPGVISGFLLAFTLSIDDFVITVFNNGSFQTLSTFIYADARKGGLTPSLRALSTLIFVFVLALLLIVNIRSRRAEKHAVKIK
ncbi:MAG: ABC transporter permease subunit, partial [Clostridia bacterium]